jgi:hypothetical protein
MNSLTLISGGQSGVDRAALEAAEILGLPYRGFCPRGGWAEDLEQPPGIRALYPELIETASSDPAVRTKLNVHLGWGTLLLTTPEAVSAGVDLTRDLARRYSRLLICDPADTSFIPMVRKWLRVTESLNVAGPRESEAPGIGHAGLEFLVRLLGPQG